MSLYTNYISALRNIRGVLGFKPDEDISAELGWLEAKFKHRDIGVGSAQLSVVPDSTMRQRFKQRPLVLLPPPCAALEQLLEPLFRRKDLPLFVAESVLMASSYVSPLLILKRESVPLYEPLVLCSMTASLPREDADLRLHIRIADYAVLDFHRTQAEAGYEALQKFAKAAVRGNATNARAALDAAIRERKTLAAKDLTTRFWRLAQNPPATKGRTKNLSAPFVLYLDPLMLFRPLCRTKKSLAAVPRELDETLALALSPLVAIVIDL